MRDWPAVWRVWAVLITVVVLVQGVCLIELMRR